MNRIITGDGLRKTRFHDQDGHLIGLIDALDVFPCVLDLAMYKLFGYKRPVPWLGYSSVSGIKSLLQPEHKVLEFGAGMSTIWFSYRVSEIVSIETDYEWIDKIIRKTSWNCKVKMIHPKGRPILDIFDKISDNYFDFALVDGAQQRDICVEIAKNKVKPKGYIFLDNSDCAEYQKARESILKLGDFEIFHNFCPGSLSVNESILARNKK